MEKFLNGILTGWCFIVSAVSSFVRGFKNGVKLIRKDLFNDRIPMWACYIVGVLSVPLNIIFVAILLLICAARRNWKPIQELWEWSLEIGNS